MTSSSKPDSNRPIRSYVIRSGRFTTSQRTAIEQHWVKYGIDYDAAPLPLEEIFPGGTRLIVEIGFGMGNSLLQMAREQTESSFIGIDVYKPGVGKLLHGIAEHGLTNLRIICHDAQTHF